MLDCRDLHWYDKWQTLLFEHVQSPCALTRSTPVKNMVPITCRKMLSTKKITAPGHPLRKQDV
eukprot:4648619-Amphidinium_carterae.2